LVLVVEDDDTLRDILLEVIRETGAEVEVVATADDGLTTLKRRADIELLLTDVKTPGRLSGWDLAKAAYERRPNLPVIIMSGYSYQPGAELPPNACFVHKPCPLDTLVAMVKARLMRAHSPGSHL
jgi:DNA-binding NtrC family response regulator